MADNETRDTSDEIRDELRAQFAAANLHRPMRVKRYDAGAELTFQVTSVAHASQAVVRLSIEKFVGGGFAGQVYQVRVLDIQGPPIPGLEPGNLYAMKILVPPSGFSRLFRNVLYWIGFQGHFQLQVNPAAARAGALWQKFIRRAAAVRFGSEDAVVDIHATFVDEQLGSCGELSEWIDGRTWQLEVDNRMDLLKCWRRGKSIDESAAAELGSPEYRAKRTFMSEFVRLLYDMGAYEFARQYEWSTCKSQPNCLKRRSTNDGPQAGLTAVDFRAGLALLAFLPMSPGDFKLILKGLMRGSLVQFDRGNLRKLEAFVNAHPGQFADMQPLLEELKACEQTYRSSVPDITHNHVRLLYSPKLWSTMLDSAVTGWRVRNLLDDEHEPTLRKSRILTLLFFMIGVVPFLGKILRRIWGRADWRKHYAAMSSSWDYLCRAVRGRIAEKLTTWHRAGRINNEKARRIAGNVSLFLLHLPLSILPAGLHRFLTDRKFAREKLAYIFVRPFRLYFSRKLREQWLRDMVQEGKKKHILTDEDAEIILSQLSERYIQRYLISMVVHLLTLPVTQIVSGIHIIIWNMMHPEATPGDRTAVSIAIAAIYQIIPISPGSFCRGLWAVGIAVYDRSFKDYNIAVFLSFFKYIGYLAFPIQMTYHYPVLARFMAAHWATEAVHIVPVFGERGALLEHWVFGLFYNWPLTIRRRMRKRAEFRATKRPRYWHAAVCAVAAAGILAVAEFIYLRNTAQLPPLKLYWWWLAVLVPVVLACSAAVTLFAGGTALWKRIIAATVCGIAIAVLYSTATTVHCLDDGLLSVKELARSSIWRVFVFAIISPIGTIITELSLPDVDKK